MKNKTQQQKIDIMLVESIDILQNRIISLEKKFVVLVGIFKEEIKIINNNENYINHLKKKKLKDMGIILK